MAFLQSAETPLRARLLVGGDSHPGPLPALHQAVERRELGLLLSCLSQCAFAGAGAGPESGGDGRVSLNEVI